jgi:integrase
LAEIAVEKKPSALRSARYIFNAAVLPKLGHLLVERLTPEQINRWRNELAASGKRIRTKKYADQPARCPPPTSEHGRRRPPATANRVLTMLKAALNRAYHAGRAPSDAAWRKVTPFRQVDEAVIQYLRNDEIRRLVNAYEGDFRPLVQAGLLTGCRYSELATSSAPTLTATAIRSSSNKPRVADPAMLCSRRKHGICSASGRSAGQRTRGSS